jgi:hypothetical protein
VQHEAALFGKRVAEMATDEERVRRMYEFAFARRPAPAELDRALAFIRECSPGADAWRDLAHALFQMKEFIYLR